MKIKIINPNRTETAGKNNTLLSQLRKSYEDISMSDSAEEAEFDKSCDSIGSNIRVINGSFSNLKPIEGPESFKPEVTSTPNNYEEENDITNPVPSTSKMEYSNNIQDEHLNMTFNFETDVVNEKLSYQQYLEEMTGFVTRTQHVVEEKLRKRTLLLKKISKYQKKIRNMEKSLRRIEKVVNFGAELPNLCESIFKST